MNYVARKVSYQGFLRANQDIFRQSYKSEEQEVAQAAYAQTSNNWPKPYEKMSDFLVRDKREKADRFLDGLKGDEVK